MIEGGSSKEFIKAKKMLQEDPDALHLLLNHLSESVILYLNAQINAGAQVIMIFDTWGGILTTSAYMEFSLFYMKKIYDHLKNKFNGLTVPVILFTKGSHLWVDDIAKTGCDAISLDWQCNIGEVRRKVGDHVALQGNMNPAVLKEKKETIVKEVESILDSYGRGPGHIFNLGHGITPDIDPENVEVLVEAVHDLSKKYHAK
jgi:uroporphyrinogen decarboxylase